MRNNYINTNKFKSAAFKTLLLASLFFGFSASLALAATLSVSPNTGVYTAGQNFTAQVVVNTSGASINAADGALKFNPSELSVVGISKGAIFNLWTADPTFSNSAGTISFSGGNPTGYKGAAGTILTITFKAKAAGNPKVSFSSGSVLAADGRGTNVLTNMNGGTYTIAAAGSTPEPEVIEYVAPANTPGTPSISSATHPDPAKYYPVKTAKLSWSLPAGVTAVRTLLDSNSGSIPTRVYDTPISEITLEDLDEGVQYFHLQFKNADGWGKVAHYRLAVDTEKPTEFSISLVPEADLSSPIQTLLFTVKDDTSKVSRYLIQLDGAEPYEYIDETGSSTATLAALDPGHHSVIVEAFDQANNSLISTFSFGILAFDKPQFTDYPTRINEEVIPVIKGITRPNSTVEISLAKIGAEPQTYEIKSTDNGEFIFIPEGRLTQGVYELIAVAVDQYGAKSEPSDTIRIVVEQPGYLKIGSMIVNILSVIIPLAAMLLLAIFGLLLLIRKMRTLRTSVERESKEASIIAKGEFSALLKELDQQEELLSKSRKTGKLTKAEDTLLTSIRKRITEAEAKVEKEITDVKDIVD